MSSVQYAPISDGKLVQEAIAGDAAAMEILLGRHVKTSIAFASTFLSNREDALDVAQTALMKMSAELIPGWNGRSFKACLYVRVHNAAAGLIRQDASRRRREKNIRIQSDAAASGTEAGFERKEVVRVLREEASLLPKETSTLPSRWNAGGAGCRRNGSNGGCV